MCLCTTPNAYVVPNARAKQIGRLLLFIMLALVILLIVGFVGKYYSIAILSIGLVITGWCGVRDPNVFNIEQILCVCLFSAYLWVYTIVDVIIYLTSINTTPDLDYPRLISMFGFVIFYLASTYFSKKLYDELRLHYVRPIQQPGGLFGPFGGGPASNPWANRRVANPYAQQNPQQQQFINQGGGGQIAPNQGQKKSFQAFSGQGHQLG
mmetsp:Transcript_21941/g.27033  ORF Transcript_21941/g.27033 Transcript_21941/m.27033 type:complete len:209 (-) Transcript_21941:156-782(-)